MTRRVRACVAGVCLVFVGLLGCGDGQAVRIAPGGAPSTVVGPSAPRPCAPVTSPRCLIIRASHDPVFRRAITRYATGALLARNRQVWIETAAWNEAAKPKIVQTYRPKYVTSHTARRSAAIPVVVAPVPLNGAMAYPSIAACIKGAESGNYAEASHIRDGSGAYQFIPRTWRYYATLAGFGQYAYAYQAPPAVQDAVLNYALTHGGAGNWSNRYGKDHCTAALPGGG